MVDFVNQFTAVDFKLSELAASTHRNNSTH